MKYRLTTGFESIKTASPGVAFLYLLFLIALGLTIASILNFTIIALFWGLSPAQVSEMMANPTLSGNKTLLMLSQALTSLGVFVLPALVFLKLRNKRVVSQAGSFGVFAAALSMIIMILQAPLIDFTAALNQRLDVSGFLPGLQQWMINSETEAKLLTDSFLNMHSGSDLVLALVVMALIPALGEELLFRAGIQSLLFQAFRNKHVAIWLTAFLFSFIHFQFFGFLPRFLLGALLGYLFTEGGSVVYSIVAHFTNNALAVLSAFPAFAGMQAPHWFSDFPAAAVSLAVAVAGVFLLRRMRSGGV
jgi:membrane protease YdiL (CAAX protease family)